MTRAQRKDQIRRRALLRLERAIVEAKRLARLLRPLAPNDPLRQTLQRLYGHNVHPDDPVR